MEQGSKLADTLEAEANKQLEALIPRPGSPFLPLLMALPFLLYEVRGLQHWQESLFFVLIALSSCALSLLYDRLVRLHTSTFADTGRRYYGKLIEKQGYLAIAAEPELPERYARLPSARFTAPLSLPGTIPKDLSKRLAHLRVVLREWLRADRREPVPAGIETLRQRLELWGAGSVILGIGLGMLLIVWFSRLHGLPTYAYWLGLGLLASLGSGGTLFAYSHHIRQVLEWSGQLAVADILRGTGRLSSESEAQARRSD